MPGNSVENHSEGNGRQVSLASHFLFYLLLCQNLPFSSGKPSLLETEITIAHTHTHTHTHKFAGKINLCWKEFISMHHRRVCADSSSLGEGLISLSRVYVCLSLPHRMTHPRMLRERSSRRPAGSQGWGKRWKRPGRRRSGLPSSVCSYSVQIPALPRKHSQVWWG